MRADVDGLVTFTMDTSEEMEVARNLGMRELSMFTRVPYGGGASAGVVMQAAMAVATGVAENVVCYRAFNERSGNRFGTASAEVTTLPLWFAWYAPYGLMTPAAWVALHARRYMETYGVTNADFGRIAVVDRDARGDQSRTRGSTSGRSPSRTIRRRGGSSSPCCGCSTAVRRATVASRSS